MTTTKTSKGLYCHICHAVLDVRPARGRKSGKRFVSLVCPADGRHIRAFVGDAEYVGKVLDQAEG